MSGLEKARSIVREKNGWMKSHGLGNDYIVLNSKNIDFDMNEGNVVRICDEHYGIGSDGILLMTDSANADFGLVIYNPDGSTAEKKRQRTKDIYRLSV